MTVRRACSALHFDRSTYPYRSRRTDPALLKKRIKEICETHVRYGYRRVYCILRRDGRIVNMKKVYRFYRELGLQLRNKTPNCGPRRSCAKTGFLQSDRTMFGRWTSFTTSSRRAASCLYWRWSIPTLGYRRWSIRGSAIAVRTLSQPWTRLPGGSAMPRRSGSALTASLSLGTWICGLTSAATSSTSAVLANPQTNCSSKRSTASCAANA